MNTNDCGLGTAIEHVPGVRETRLLLKVPDSPGVRQPDVLVRRRGDGWTVYVHTDGRSDPVAEVWIPDIEAQPVKVYSESS